MPAAPIAVIYNPLAMKKNRIVTRVKDRTGITKSKNRSEDLIELRQKYAQFTKNLKFLITALNSNHASMMSYSKSRLEVAKAINSLTVDTPLFKCAGDIPANAVGTTDGGSATDNSAASESVVAYNPSPTSYAAIHLQLHKKNKMYAEKYAEHVINYASEWERILSTRVSKHLKESDKLRVDLDHYAKKVDDLNKTMNKTMSKGKSVADSNVDKLKRNEQKLVQARQEHDRFVNDLCGFMEEIMERGWKDLHPLLVKMAQFDATLSNEEAMLLKGSMASVAEQMKGMATKYPNLKPQGRLKELESWSLESLNKVNPSMRSDSPLMITQGGGENAEYTTALGSGGGGGSIHAGLGGPGPEVGGGGTFGTQQQMVRTDSFASSNAGDSQSGYDWATGGGGGMQNTGVHRAASFRVSAPSSGGLPPLNPGSRTGSFAEPPQRANSHGDFGAASQMLTTMQAAAPPPTLDDIFSSGSVAPAPSGIPPPPPSMPPPPPPQNALSPQMGAMSMYDSSPGPPAHPSMSPRGNPGYLSPGAASTGSNPFGDGGFGGGPGTPSQPNPYGGGPGTPSQSNPYGGGPGTPSQQNPYGGGAPTNPFG